MHYNGRLKIELLWRACNSTQDSFAQSLTSTSVCEKRRICEWKQDVLSVFHNIYSYITVVAPPAPLRFILTSVTAQVGEKRASLNAATSCFSSKPPFFFMFSLMHLKSQRTHQKLFWMLAMCGSWQSIFFVPMFECVYLCKLFAYIHVHNMVFICVHAQVSSLAKRACQSEWASECASGSRNGGEEKQTGKQKEGWQESVQKQVVQE